MCDDCRVSHSDHNEAIENIMSVTQEKVQQVNSLKQQLEEIEKVFISTEEIHSTITAQVAEVYDNYINDVIKYKDKFIEQYLLKIYSKEGMKEVLNPKYKLQEVKQQIEKVLAQLKEIVYKSDEVLGDSINVLEDVGKLPEAISYLSRINSNSQEVLEFHLEYDFDENYMNNMFETHLDNTMDGNFIPQVTNEGGVIRIYDMALERSRIITINKRGFPSFSATCVLGDRVYVGGNDSDDHVAAYFYEVNGNNGICKQLLSMIEKRSIFTLIAVNENEIYALGGFDQPKQYGTYYLDRCEKYLINRNQWYAIAPLNQGRCHHAATYFQTTKEIYVFGGWASPFDTLTDTIEKISVLGNNRWEKVNLNTKSTWGPTRDIQSRAISKFEILIFGHDNYIFDVRKSSMYSVPRPQGVADLFSCRVSSIVNKGKIYCFNDDNENEIVEYEIRNRKWNIIGV